MFQALGLRNWRLPLMWIHYTLFAVAGVASFIFPSRAIQFAVPPWGTYVWASFYLVGAICCLIGMAFRTRAGELVGLPMLSSASVIYATAVIIQFFIILDGAYLAVSALLLGQAFSLAERWITAMVLFRSIQGAASNGT